LILHLSDRTYHQSQISSTSAQTLEFVTMSDDDDYYDDYDDGDEWIYFDEISLGLAVSLSCQSIHPDMYLMVGIG